MVQLKQGERMDYIYKDLPIIQSSSHLSFSIDAVLLAQFTSVVRTKGKMIDLCTGNGVIPLVLSRRSKVPIVGVEIQKTLCEMAMRSVILNDTETQIHIDHGDLMDAPEKYGQGTFDIVTCNPPYFPLINEKEVNENKALAIARHELYCTLDDVVRVGSLLLKQRGKMSIVIRPERLNDVFQSFSTYRLEPKRIRFVHPKKDMDANIVMVEGMKVGKPGLTCLAPITVYSQAGNYTEGFKRCYEGKER